MDLGALSEREREVLDLALAGLSAREMAERLTLTEATIRSHLARVYAKLGVSGRIELMARFRSATERGSPSDAPATTGARPTTEPEPASPTRPTAEPPRARPRRRTLAVAGILAAAIAVSLTVVWWQSSPPPQTTLANLSQMLVAGKVQALEKRDDTLFVTTADGARYRVERIDEEVTGGMGVWAWVQAVEPTATEHVTFSVTKPRNADWLPFLAMALDIAVAAFLAVLAFATLRWILRSTPPRRSI